MRHEGLHSMITDQLHEGASVGDRFGQLVAIKSAAEYLSVSRATVERLVYRGELPIVKIGGSTRYDVDDLDGYIESNRRRNRARTA
jgi:excisionase family DNA binding protein